MEYIKFVLFIIVDTNKKEKKTAKKVLPTLGKLITVSTGLTA